MLSSDKVTYLFHISQTRISQLSHCSDVQCVQQLHTASEKQHYCQFVFPETVLSGVVKHFLRLLMLQH